MHAKRLAPWWLVCALVTAPVFAAPPSLEDVLRSADEHHPSIAVAILDVAMARGELTASEGAFDPVLKGKADLDTGYYQSGTGDVWLDVPTPLWGTSLQAGWRVGLGEFPTYDGKKLTNDYGEARLGLLIPLLRDGFTDRRRTNIGRLDIETRVQQQALALARVEIRRQATLAYVEWQAASERALVAQSLLELAMTRTSQLEQRAAAGDVSPVEVTDNQRLVAQRRARVVVARRALEKSAIDMSLFWRTDDGKRIVEKDSLPARLATRATSELKLEEDVQQALAQRPDLQRLRMNVEQLQLEASFAWSQLLPNLQLSLAASQDIGDATAAVDPPSTAWQADGKTRSTPEFDIGLTFDMPVLLRQARGRQAVVEAQRERAQQSIRLLEDRIRNDVEDAHSAERAATERAIAARAEIDAALQVQVAEQSRFDAGDSTLLQVNLREVATAEAQVVLVDALADLMRANAARAAALATLPN
jgi:outer membrane protein, heavy metal efflux system